jgi:quercetin dioxygenase-like cupin family protein
MFSARRRGSNAVAVDILFPKPRRIKVTRTSATSIGDNPRVPRSLRLVTYNAFGSGGEAGRPWLDLGIAGVWGRFKILVLVCIRLLSKINQEEGGVMMRGRFIGAAVLMLVLGWGQSVCSAAETAPKENKGLKTGKTEIVDLGPEIEGMQGRELRLRVLTIEPGGHIGIHSHKDRPSVAYFLQGTDTVTYADGTKKQFHAGDVTSANKGTTHWHENSGTEPVVLIIADIFHPKK